MKKRNLQPPQLLTYLVPIQIVGMLVGLVFATATASGSGSVASLNDPGSVSIFFGFSLVGLFSGIASWAVAFNRFVKDPDVAKNRTDRINSVRRKIRIRIQANDAAQLDKKNFDERLQLFLGGGKSAGPNADSYVSKMPYWQLTSFGKGKMPKPIEAIRALLLRIRRSVQSNSN